MMPYRAQRVLTNARRRLAVLRGMAHMDTYNPAGTVLLAGSGRSGTTWLGQIINHGNAYRDVFEPLHPQRMKALRGWPAMRYVPANAPAGDEAVLLRVLLAGRVRSAWTDAYNRKALANRRLIKVIRANLMLGWIKHHVPQASLLFALRHPCAVAYSRLKLGWDTHLDELLAQPELMRDHLEPFREQIERAAFEGDAWDRHLMMWCIENVVPLRELRPGDTHVMFYERFCEDFDTECDALFRYLGRGVPAGIDRSRRQHSAHFRRDSAILRGTSLIDDWQSRVNTHQVDRALAMLDLFGLNHLYNEKALPRCGRDSVFLDPAPTATPARQHKEAA